MRTSTKEKAIKSVITFFILFVILLIIQRIFNITEKQYRYDVDYYNALGRSLFKSGKYSLSTLLDDFRGIIYPSYIGICRFINKKIGIDYSIHIISSMVYAFFLTAFLNFCSGFLGDKEHKSGLLEWGIRSGAVIGLLIWFFYGLIIYPLTDLYTALICILSGYLIYKASNAKAPGKYMKYFFAGVLIYLAYNIRTIYQLSLFIFLFLIILFEFRNKSLRIAVASLSANIGGILFGAIPQLLLNWERYQKVSIWINNENLFARQLQWGLKYSRYGTYVGKDWMDGLAFIDNAGLRIITEWNESGLPVTVGSYFRLFLKYPFEYIAIITKHIYNAFIVIFPEQYVSNLQSNFIVLALLSLIIVFVSGILLLVTICEGKLNCKKVMLVLGMVFPSVAIIFGAVEERFMVLPYLLIYGFLAFYNYGNLKKYINKKNVLIVMAVFVIFLATALAIESEILGSMVYFPVYLTN